MLPREYFIYGFLCHTWNGIKNGIVQCAIHLHLSFNIVVANVAEKEKQLVEMLLFCSWNFSGTNFFIL
jgi:hypothetical protein